VLTAYAWEGRCHGFDSSDHSDLTLARRLADMGLQPFVGLRPKRDCRFAVSRLVGTADFSNGALGVLTTGPGGKQDGFSRSEKRGRAYVGGGRNIILERKERRKCFAQLRNCSLSPSCSAFYC